MKIYLFDIDGVIINSEPFTHGIEEIFGIDKNFLVDFFAKDFSDCLIGRKDLKSSIKHHLDCSKWQYGVDKLLEFWFDFENKPDLDLLSKIEKLRKEGNICCMVSNQEKYRADYLINVMKLGEYFNEDFFSCDLGVKKPNIDFFVKVYGKLQDLYGTINKHNIYFYDDDSKNIENGNIFGFNCYIYNKNLII